MNTKTRLATLVIAATAAVALCGAATPANAARPAPEARPRTAVVENGGCSSSYTQGWTSVDMVITNTTDFTLNFDPDLSGPSTGHWHERPASTLGPGQCEVVNAYASTDIHVFNLNVVYSTAWGDYMPFQGVANATNSVYNEAVFQNVPEYHENSYYWSGAVDTRYSISQATPEVGMLHTHFDLQLS
ncbi:hypothetical protein [Gryllotalpicola koreensis]|uniref:Uncharacterized protein n=1 Tax=Gryllotalpicola koreensis TaxID=993086 RepID=A0ABP7ZWX2_9MICO